MSILFGSDEPDISAFLKIIFYYNHENLLLLLLLFIAVLETSDRPIINKDLCVDLVVHGGASGSGLSKDDIPIRNNLIQLHVGYYNIIVHEPPHIH